MCKTQCAERGNEITHLQELLERVQNDKTKLSRRVSKLVQNGKRNERADASVELVRLRFRTRTSPRIATLPSNDQSGDSDGVRQHDVEEIIVVLARRCAPEECRRRTRHVQKRTGSSAKIESGSIADRRPANARPIVVVGQPTRHGHVARLAAEPTLDQRLQPLADALHSLRIESKSFVADEGQLFSSPRSIDRRFLSRISTMNERDANEPS